MSVKAVGITSSNTTDGIDHTREVTGTRKVYSLIHELLMNCALNL